MKIIFFLLLGSVVLALPFAVQAQFDYTTNNGTITITGYTGPGGMVTIPSETNNLPVTSIGPATFFGATNLTSVTIPDSVTSIEDGGMVGVFFGCTSLTNVTIGNSVTNIGAVAFDGCTSLPRVTIPDSVTRVGGEAFRSCANLGSITIGKSVANIGETAFFDCVALKTVTLPNSLTTIGDGAFGGCTSLTNVFIPKSVTNIGVGPFLYCADLSNITVDTLNPSFSSLDGVLFNHDRTTLIAYAQGKGVSYAIPAGVNNIGDSAFYYCTSLRDVSFPSTVTNIDGYAFSSCSSLPSVTLPSSLSAIGSYAFSYCSGLTAVVIPAGVKSIGEGVFTSSTSLMSITVDADNLSYASVDGVLFNHSRTLLLQVPAGRRGNYAIPAGVTGLGEAAFASCYSLTSVTIPEGVTSIPNWTFNSCDSLADIVIPNTVTSIGYLAFGYCGNLTNITLGNKVTDIGSGAFSGCYSLKGVHFTGNAPTPSLDVVGGASDEVVYYLPGTTGWGSTFGSLPTALWALSNPLILQSGPGFGVQTNGFGFTISWATNASVVVEASANLTNPTWVPLQTNILSGGTSYFREPPWTNYSGRFYRLRMP